MNLATLTRDVREALGLSLREGARILGTTCVDLGRIERGKQPLTEVQFVEVVDKWCEGSRLKLAHGTKAFRDRLSKASGDS